MMYVRGGTNVECLGYQYVPLGSISTIARGASPRPIKNFITDSLEGVNWIKIGDVKAGSKYITETAERITREGAKKSRLVKKGDFVIVSTDRGEQFCEVITDIINVDESKLNVPLGDVIRIASDSDVVMNEKNLDDAKKALEDAKDFVYELGLGMKILSTYFTFDRKQLVFNFLADERVDFRELAKKLAYVYKTRIELRQIGIRDKAKTVGGYGPCGRKLCCSSFLDDMNSVSINMAKNQNLALNPQKINGVCGRLMCCLTYENDCYCEYKKGLPRVNEKVVVSGEPGKVISVDLFSRTYKVETENSKVIVVNVDE